MDSLSIMKVDDRFGGLFGKIFDNVDSIIDKALARTSQVGVELLSATGRQIELAIANVEAAFKKSVKESANEVKGVAKDILDELQKIETEFVTAVDSQMDDLKGRALVIIDKLPLISDVPLLRTTHPTNLINVEGKAQYVTLEGSFPASYPHGTPTLTFGNVSCILVANTIQSLEFEVPLSIFSSTEPHKFSHLSSGELNITRNASWWKPDWWWNQDLETIVYRIALGALPKLPATKITVHLQETRLDPQENTFVTPTAPNYFELHGYEYAHKQNWVDTYHDITPTPVEDPTLGKWKINLRKPPVINHLPQDTGTCVADFVTPISENVARLHLGVNSKHGTHMGNIKCNVTVHEIKDTPINVPIDQDISNLKWGDTHHITVTAQQRFAGVTIESYDGSTYDWGATNHATGPFKLSPVGDDTWELSAVVPAQV